jgi:adenine-specific DNA-methyltransferase
MIKYIGSKRALLPWILQVVDRLVEVESLRLALDPFSGSARVAHALKARGFQVIASDYANYAYILAKALVEADARIYPPERIRPILDYLNKLPGEEGWFTETYAYKARFFQPFNAARIERIRKEIDVIAEGDERLRAILLTSLMLAADKVDSTTGIQMAFLKKWAPRSYNPLRLEYPPLLPGEGTALLGDAIDIVKEHAVDLLYLDPPYNQHSYLANYHIWETLVLFDAPTCYGIAQKRTDVQSRKSDFNSRRSAKEALRKVIHNARAKVIMLSFNNEGFHTETDILELAREKGYVAVLRHPYKRYIGAQIGIYNPKGEKVGKISHLKNEELLFVISQDKRFVEKLNQKTVDFMGQVGLFDI